MVHYPRHPRQRSVHRDQNPAIVALLRTTVQNLQADNQLLDRLSANPRKYAEDLNAISNAIIEAVHVIAPTELDCVSKALFALVPSAAEPWPPPQENPAKLLARIQKENRRVPTYGGFFLPCLELLVRVPDSAFREACRKALLDMLSSTTSHGGETEQSRFAATSLAGILDFRDYLREYAAKSPPH